MVASGPAVEKKDFTSELAAAIPESVTIARERSLDDAIVLLLSLEKKCRVNNDITNLKEVCLHMVRLCRDRNDWAKLASVVTVINKRRAQSRHAVSVVVAEVLTYVDAAPSLEVKIDVIKCLKDVCEGKIYVEGESARLHMMLAIIYEDRGDIAAACDMIQDVHIETYGSLSKEEKAKYILEQIRLNLLRKDYIRAIIQSRKMNRKTIEEPGFEEIKIKYYNMMVEYHTQENDVWEICQCYYKVRFFLLPTRFHHSTRSTPPPLPSSFADFRHISDQGNQRPDANRSRELHRFSLVEQVLQSPERHDAPSQAAQGDRVYAPVERGAGPFHPTRDHPAPVCGAADH